MNKKTIIKYICVLFVVLVAMFLLRGKFAGAIYDDYNNALAEFQEIPMAGSVIEQPLKVQGSVMTMQIFVKNSGHREESICFELWDAQKTRNYKTTEVVVPATGNQESIAYLFLEPEELQGITDLLLIIDGSDSENTVSVCVQEDTKGQPGSYNGNIENWHVRMSIIYGTTFYWGFFLLFGAVLFIIGIAFVYAWEKKLKAEKLFAIIVITAGIGIALVNPLAQEPDGWSHYVRTLDVSYGNVLAPFINNAHEGGYNMLPENINEIPYEVIDAGAGEGYSYLKSLMGIKFSKEAVLMEGECGYTSLFYMPQALGTLIGRLLNLSIYGCLVLGRILNLICYVALTYLALKLIPVYKNLLTVIAMLPMTVYQASSYSPDAMLNGLCFLFIGLCLYYAYGEKERLSWKHVIWLGILLALVFTCKYVYVCLGLLVFLIPAKKFGTKKEYWKAFGIAILPIVIIILLFGLRSGINMIQTAKPEITPGGEAESVVGEEDLPTQLDYVLKHPIHLVKAVYRTVKTYFNRYVQWLNSLGTLNYSLGVLETIIPCFMIGVACLDTEKIQEKVKRRHRILFLFTGGITVLAGMIGLYLMDMNENYVGAPLINGYQTRYAIPCMVLLLGIFASGKVTNRIKNFSYKVIGCMGVFLIYTIYTLIQICY